MLKLSKKWQALFLKKTLAITLILISIFTLTPQLPVMAADAPISLSPSMVTNESGRGNAGNLVDESNNAGYPPTSDPSTNWFPGWSSSYYPASAYIDLGQQYTISQIWFRDENGTGNVTFSAGSPGNWNFLFNDTLGGFLIWNQRSVSTTTRYLRITLSTSSTAQSLYDIVLYGQPAIDTTPPQRSNPAPQGTLPVDTTQTTLSLTTNETAQCRWSQTLNIDFSAMTDTFTNTNSTNHSTLVADLTNGNTYNYYVRCQDQLGNSNPDDFAISFNVAATETIPPLRSNPAPAGTIKSSFNNGNYQIQLKLAGESQIAEILTFPLSENNPLPFYRNNIIRAAEFTLADQNPDGTFNNEISSILGPPGRILMMAYRITGDKRYYNALLPYLPTFNCGQVGDHLTYETYALAEFQLWSKDNQFEPLLAICAQNAFDLWISPNDQYFEKAEVSGSFYEAWEATGNPIYKSYGDQVIQSLLNANSWYDAKNTWYSLSNQTYEDGVYTGALTAFGLYGYNDPTYIDYAQRAQNFFVPQFYQKSTFGPAPSLSPYSMKITDDPVWGGGVSGHYSHFASEVAIANFLLYKATGDRQWLLRATNAASWFSQSQEPNGSYFDNADNYRDNTSAEWSTLWAIWAIYRFPAEAYVEIVDKNYNTLINDAFWNENKEYLLALATTPNGENGALKFTLPEGRTVSSISIDQTPTTNFTQTGQEVIVNLTGNGLAQKVAVFYGTASSFTDPVAFDWPQYSPTDSSAVKTVRGALYKPAYGDGEQVELSVWPMQEGQSIEGNTRTIGLTQDAQFRVLNPEGVAVWDWQTIPVTNSWGTTTFPLTTTTNQAVISLTTDEVAQCRFSQTPNTDFSAMTDTFTNTNSTTHSTLVTGFSDGNTYNYYVRCQDQLGNTNPDDFVISFEVYTPQIDATPPVISNVSSVPTATSSQITWTTDESADSQVEYGTTPALGSQTSLDANLLTNHQATISALSPQTLYYYKVKSKDAAGNLAEGPVSTFTTQAAPEGPISLSPSMVTNESGRGNAGNLVDESNNAGYPPTSDPSTYWMPGWSSSYYPASAYIDLGQNYALSEVWLRDENGIGNVTISTGSQGNWTTLVTDPMTGFLRWNKWTVSTNTRYLRITLATTGAAQSLYDLVLYGRPQ